MPTRTGKYTGLLSTVSWTPAGGSLVTFTGMVSVRVMINDQLIDFTGDAAVFSTLLVSAKGSRGLQLSGYDVSKMARLFTKGPGTLVVTVNDPINGTGTGAITYTLSNAMRAELGPQHANQSADSNSVTYMAFSSDGTTDPLTIAEAT